MVTYCGLYCDLCSQRARIPERAQSLKDILTKEGFEFWSKGMAGSEEFWEFLGNLSDMDKSCPGCRQGGGNPGCDLRKCAKEKGVEVCCFCNEFPCERINDFSKVYPTVIAEQWMAGHFYGGQGKSGGCRSESVFHFGAGLSAQSSIWTGSPFGNRA